METPGMEKFLDVVKEVLEKRLPLMPQPLKDLKIKEMLEDISKGIDETKIINNG